jgi:hypothetical protein
MQPGSEQLVPEIPRRLRTIPRPARRVGVAVGVAGLVLAMMGCAPGGSGGQSKESADATLSSISGVAEASVDTRSSTNGFQKQTSTTIEVTLDSGFSIPDPGALVDYLVRVAWSTGTKEANTSVEVIVLSDPQISVQDALAAEEWANTASDPNNPQEAVLLASEVKERLGDWPGEVPELPDGIIVGPTPEPSA